MRALAGIALLLACTACMPSVQPSTYSVGSVGQVNRSIAATVVSARPVTIDGTTGAGGATGAGLGAVAGSSMGDGTRANVAGAIGGAVIGAIAGSALERRGAVGSGAEYVVQTSAGSMMTIVQGGPVEFAAGAKVLVLYGSPARLIPDPR